MSSPSPFLSPVTDAVGTVDEDPECTDDRLGVRAQACRLVYSTPEELVRRFVFRFRMCVSVCAGERIRRMRNRNPPVLLSVALKRRVTIALQLQGGERERTRDLSLS